MFVIVRMAKFRRMHGNATAQSNREAPFPYLPNRRGAGALTHLARMPAARTKVSYAGSAPECFDFDVAMQLVGRGILCGQP